jgi:hypothetical protein
MGPQASDAGGTADASPRDQEDNNMKRTVSWFRPTILCSFAVAAFVTSACDKRTSTSSSGTGAASGTTSGTTSGGSSTGTKWSCSCSYKVTTKGSTEVGFYKNGWCSSGYSNSEIVSKTKSACVADLKGTYGSSATATCSCSCTASGTCTKKANPSGCNSASRALCQSSYDDCLDDCAGSVDADGCRSDCGSDLEDCHDYFGCKQITAAERVSDETAPD